MQDSYPSYPVLPLWGLAFLCASACWCLDRTAPSAPPVEARTKTPHVARIFTAPSAQYRPASCGQPPTERATPACDPAWTGGAGRPGGVRPWRFTDPNHDRPGPRGF